MIGTNKLEELLKDINKSIPFYKKLKVEEFNNLPVINKNTIKTKYDEFISDAYIDKDEILRHINNKFEISKYIIEKRINPNVILEWTSGSSGIPFKCVKSVKERKQIALSLWRTRMNVDHKITAKKFFPLIHTGLSTCDYNIRDYSKSNIESLYTAIKNQQIVCLHATPNLLKRHILLSGIDIEFFKGIVPYIEVTGNYLSDEDRKLLEQTFDAKVLNLYGLIEVWGIAYATSNDYMKQMQGNVYIELINEKGEIIKNYNEKGRVIVTGLNQRIMPFIRYDTGDYAMYIYREKEQPYSCIKLCRDREVNKILINNQFKSGTQFAKEVIRKIFWKQDFPDIKYICLVQEKDVFRLVLNLINNQEDFENISYEIIVKILQKEVIIKYSYVSEEDYNKINPKGYLFVRRG